jgi:hypothetical protein
LLPYIGRIDRQKLVLKILPAKCGGFEPCVGGLEQNISGNDNIFKTKTNVIFFIIISLKSLDCFRKWQKHQVYSWIAIRYWMWVLPRRLLLGFWPRDFSEVKLEGGHHG